MRRTGLTSIKLWPHSIAFMTSSCCFLTHSSPGFFSHSGIPRISTSLLRKCFCCVEESLPKLISRIVRDSGGGRTAKSSSPSSSRPVVVSTRVFMFFLMFLLKAPTHMTFFGSGTPSSVLSTSTSFTMPITEVDVHSSMNPTTLRSPPSFLTFSALSTTLPTISRNIFGVMCWCI